MTLNKYSSLLSFLQVFITSACLFLIYFNIKSKFGIEFLGLFSLVSSFLSFITIFGSGISGRLLHKIPTLVNDNEISIEMSNSIALNFTISVILNGGIYCFRNQLVTLLNSEFTTLNYIIQIFPLLLFISFMTIISNTFIFFNDAINKIYLRNLVSIFSNITLLISFFFFHLFGFGFNSVFYALGVQQFVQLLLYLFIYLKKYKFIFSRVICKNLFDFKESYFLNNFLIIFTDLITKFFISRFFGLKDLGLYEFTTKIFLQFKTVIAVVLYPMVIEIIKNVNNGISPNLQHIKFIVFKMRDHSQGISLILNLLLYFIVILFFILTFNSDSGWSENKLRIIFISFFYAHLSIVMLPGYFLVQGLGEIRILNYYHLAYLILFVILSSLFPLVLKIDIFILNVILITSLLLSYLVLYLVLKYKYEFHLREILNFNPFTGSHILLTCSLSVGILFVDHNVFYLKIVSAVIIIIIMSWLLVNIKKVFRLFFEIGNYSVRGI
jgi:O-antigen/teichoic acid export membrane protein